MKPGDLVLVKVVGLGAYMRTFHDEPALIVATHSNRGKPLPLYRLLWKGELIEMSASLVVPCNPPADVV